MVDNFVDPLTPADLSAWLGESITEPDDVGRAELVLGFAWSLIEGETGVPLDEWVEDGVPRAVRNVALQVAGRGYTNPDSWGNEGVDDWRGGGRPIEELGMYLTPTEKRLLSQFRKRGLTGIGVVKTVRDTPRDLADGFVPSVGGPPILWYG